MGCLPFRLFSVMQVVTVPAFAVKISRLPSSLAAPCTSFHRSPLSRSKAERLLSDGRNSGNSSPAGRRIWSDNRQGGGDSQYLSPPPPLDFY